MSENEINDSRPVQNTRGVTTGKNLKEEKEKNPEKLHIDFNEYGQPTGEYHSKFVTDLGQLIRNIKITYNDWRRVPTGQKETIWKELKLTWNITDDRNKKDVLKILSKAFREFRCTLTRTYITKTMKLPDGKVAGDSPVGKYDQIKADVWEEFKRQRMDKSFLEKSAKARASQRNNKHPHYMGRAGYAAKREKWYKEELSQELAQKKLDEDDADPDLVKQAVSSVTERINDRGYLWIKAHTPSSNAPLPRTENVIEEYKHWKEKEKTGEFVPTRLEDALVKALGNPEHNGRTRGVGGFVGLQKYFGKPPRRTTRKTYSEDEVLLLIEKAQSEAKADFKRETMEEVNMMMEKKWAEMTAKMSSLDVHIGGSFKDPSPHQRDLSSCHSTHQIDPFVELKETVRCRLALHVNGELTIVAHGMVFPWVQGKMVHNKLLTMENAHVCIDNVICGDVPLPLPWTGFTMVGDAAGSFAQWPKSLILLEENEVNSKTRNLKRKDKFKNTEESANKVQKQSLEKESVEGNNKASCDEEQDDVRPLSVEEVGKLGFFGRSLEEKLCSLSKNATIEMVIDESVYNYKEGSARSFLTIVEIRQMLRSQRLNVVMLQIWGSFLHQCATQSEAAKVVGYMCPVKLSEYMQNGRQCEDYIAHVWKIQEEKKYILGAFYESHHWMLIVTCLGLNTIYILDSDQKTTKKLDIKGRLKNAWFLHCAQGGRRNFARKNNKLIIKDDIVCPQQPSNYECGYYVMKWMYNISFLFTRSNEEQFEKLMANSTMSDADIYEIKEEWATNCLQNL